MVAVSSLSSDQSASPELSASREKSAQDDTVVERGAQFVELLEVVRQSSELGRHLAGVVLVVPEVRVGHSSLRSA